MLALQKKISAVALSSLFIALGIGFVGAQDTDNDAVSDSSQQIQLDSEEQIENAESILEQGQTICERISSTITSAQQRGDIILLDCLNPLNVQCVANITSAEERIRYLRDAVSNHDQNATNHEYTMLTILENKFEVLDTESNQCLGEDDFEVGDDRVTVEVSDDVPDEDPTVIPTAVADLPIPFIPPPASASM